MAMEHNSRDPEANEEDAGRCCRTSAISLPVNLYNLFLLFWLSENCDIFYCAFVYLFSLASAFTPDVPVSCFCTFCSLFVF